MLNKLGKNKAKLAYKRNVWWTRERCIDAGRCFFRQFNVAPTSSQAWSDLQSPTSRSNLGWLNPYPSFASILRYWPTLRQFWDECGIVVDRIHEEWSEEEDWFLTEAIGILSRVEIGDFLRRSADSVHRRAYDLGLNARTRWGWTPTRVERVLQIPAHVLWKYFDRGEVPYFRGNTYIYLDPADLIGVVQEVDWSQELPTEFTEAAMLSLRRRLVAAIAGVDWRATQPYKFHPVRTTDKRWRNVLLKPPERPTTIKPGDLVRIINPTLAEKLAAGRTGVVHTVYWSRQRSSSNAHRKTTDPCWMVRIEFKKERRHGNDRPRINYSVPLAAIEKVTSKQGKRAKAA